MKLNIEKPQQLLWYSAGDEKAFFIKLNTTYVAAHLQKHVLSVFINSAILTWFIYGAHTFGSDIYDHNEVSAFSANE